MAFYCQNDELVHHFFRRLFIRNKLSVEYLNGTSYVRKNLELQAKYEVGPGANDVAAHSVLIAAVLLCFDVPVPGGLHEKYVVVKDVQTTTLV